MTQNSQHPMFAGIRRDYMLLLGVSILILNFLILQEVYPYTRQVTSLRLSLLIFGETLIALIIIWHAVKPNKPAASAKKD